MGIRKTVTIRKDLMEKLMELQAQAILSAKPISISGLFNAIFDVFFLSLTPERRAEFIKALPTRRSQIMKAKEMINNG